MDNLTLKLVLTPALIGAATLVGRRWGQSLGGWLVGLPLTTGPVAFFIALDQGEEFAAAAALGSLAGAAAEAAFCVAYGRVAAARAGWPRALFAGTAAFAGVGVVLQGLALGPWPLLLIGVTALGLALSLMPPGAAGPVSVRPPRGDLPARMVLATVVVLLLTALAPRLGARLSGLLATYPLFGAILAAFAHRLEGGAAGIGVLRGLLFGLFSFAAFCFVLGVAFARLGTAGAFAAAIAAALVVQGVSLWRLRGRAAS